MNSRTLLATLRRSRSPSRRWRDERGATSLPELLTVSVASLVVLGAILIGLVTMDTVSGRTVSRSDDLRSMNLAMQMISRDVRGAYAVAPPYPGTPGSDVDGVSLLVQQGSSAAHDPRVWVTYLCSTTGETRSCTRTVNAAESGSCTDDGCLPPMIMASDASGTSRLGRGTPAISHARVIDGLATGASTSRVFELGWPDTGCSQGDCMTWTRPTTYADARLDPRGVYRRGADDLRPPVVRVTLQIKTGKTPVPISATTTLYPRGCVDPDAPVATANQFEC